MVIRDFGKRCRLFVKPHHSFNIDAVKEQLVASIEAGSDVRQGISLETSNNSNANFIWHSQKYAEQGIKNDWTLFSAVSVIALLIELTAESQFPV